jgi:hypothetical protein
MKVYVSLITFILITGCSSLTKSKEKKVKSNQSKYSEDVEREFSLIETEQASASRYYRELRQRDWENYKKGSNTTSRYHKIKPKNVKKRVVKRVLKKKPSYTPDQIREFQIEIGQNLSYYCMKNRKNKRFTNKEDCIAYTKDTLHKCEAKHSRQYGQVITKCLKNSLSI